MLKKLSLIILVGILSACSSPSNVNKNPIQSNEGGITEEEVITTKLRTGEITPVSIDKLSFQMISLEKSKRINITFDSPVVNFSEGNSFVSALFLPEHIDRFTFILESYADSTVFIPSVRFFDENLNEVVHIDNAEFDPRGYFVIKQIIEKDLAQNIRYAIVYSRDNDLDGTTEIVNPAREYELKKGNAVSDVIHPRLFAKHSPIGRLKIRLEDVYYSPEVIHDKLYIEESNHTRIVSPSNDIPAILTDTELFYLNQISKAIKEGNKIRADRLLNEAERAGSKKARPHYLEELEKH